MSGICALRPPRVAGSNDRIPRAESAPTRSASGRTGVSAKAAIQVRARNSLPAKLEVQTDPLSDIIEFRLF